MTESPQFAARLISASAAGYAADAANRLLEEHPDTAGRFGVWAFTVWRAHLKQRLDELSAALLADEAQLFVSEVAWSRPALKILLGGRSLVQSPRLCERIGADACGETAADAPRLGAQLIGLAPMA